MANCIRDENCGSCDFSEDCLVQRMMYPKMEIRPDFMTTKDSEGFVIECEDTREWFESGDELKFTLLLIGRTIVYFNQFLQVFYYLGMQGIGKEHVQFQIAKVTNTLGEPLLEGTSIYKERFEIMNAADYVVYRMQSGEIRRVINANRCRLIFQSPLTLKHRGEMQTHVEMEAILAAIRRRIYILNCFEGKNGSNPRENALEYDNLTVIVSGKSWPEKVMRYSGTQNSKVAFRGIRGWCDLEGLDESVIKLLLAGELLHIGKNTSFGFGRYTLVER